jgi:peptide/nickel transport system permease protein
MITTLILVSMVGFVIINLPAGSYIDFYVQERQMQGTSTSEEEIAAIVKRFGLDRPLHVQYWKWATGFVRGDFGRSFEYNREVKELIWQRLVYTALISTATLFFTWAPTSILWPTTLSPLSVWPDSPCPTFCWRWC